MKKTLPVTPWSYNKGNGLLYSAPAGLKLLLLLIFSILIFTQGPVFFPIAGLLIIGFALNSRINPLLLLRGGKNLFLLCGVIILLRTVEFVPLRINQDGFRESSVFAFTMVLSFSAGALFFISTTMGETQKALFKAERFFHLERFGIGMAISLMLGFIPLFFEMWETVELAWINRGGKNRLSKIIVLVPQVIERLMEKAAATAEALESRGFHLS